jgi:hypothetical protein
MSIASRGANWESGDSGICEHVVGIRHTTRSAADSAICVSMWKAELSPKRSAATGIYMY